MEPTEWQKKHEEEDNARFARMDEFITRMEPIMKVFEGNKIFNVEVKRRTGTIVFYIKEATTVGIFIAGAYSLIKAIFLKS